jgi:hypothetical protein
MKRSCLLPVCFIYKTTERIPKGYQWITSANINPVLHDAHIYFIDFPRVDSSYVHNKIRVL